MGEPQERANELAGRLIRAVNDDDHDAVLALLHDEVVFTPLLVKAGAVQGPFRGHDEVRDYLRRMRSYWGEGEMRLLGVHEIGDVVVAFCEADAPGDMTLTITYVGRTRAGRIAELATYADLDAVRSAIPASDRGAPAELDPLRLDLAAVPESVTATRSAVRAYLDALHVDQVVREGIALAVSEAASNVVLHAYRHVDEPGLLAVQAQREGEGVVITVADDGCGLRPRPDSPGVGLGLTLMTHEAAEVAFVVPPQRRRGTEVRMRFELDPSREAAA